MKLCLLGRVIINLVPLSAETREIILVAKLLQVPEKRPRNVARCLLETPDL